MSMLQFLNQPSQLTKFKIIQELNFQEAYPSDFSPCSPCKRVAASRCHVLSGHLRCRCTPTSHRITITNHHQIINSFQTQTPKIYFTKSLTLFPPNHHHPPPPCSTTRTAGHRAATVTSHATPTATATTIPQASFHTHKPQIIFFSKPLPIFFQASTTNHHHRNPPLPRSLAIDAPSVAAAHGSSRHHQQPPSHSQSHLSWSSLQTLTWLSSSLVCLR